MSTQCSWFDRWIFASYTTTPEGLALYRMAFALFALLFVAPGHASYASFAFLGAIPDVFYLPPPGPMQVVSGFPPWLFFESLHVLLCVSLVAVLLGLRTRVASVATALLFLVGYGFSYSLGKINHNILFVLLPALMAPSNWGAAYSLDALQARTSRAAPSWPIVLVTLTTGVAMFTAGFPKILGGWLDPTTQAAQGHVFQQFFGRNRQDFLAPLAAHTDEPVLWEAFDVATVGFEVGFLFAILHPATTRLFAAGAVFFHAGVMLVMNIAFLPNLIVYAAVLPWHRIAQWVPDGFPIPSAYGQGGWAAGLVLGPALLFYWIGSPLYWIDSSVFFVSDLTVADVLAIALSVLVVLGTVGTHIWKRRPR